MYIRFYMNVAQTLLLGVLPFVALTVFNVRIYHRFLLTRGRYSRNNNNSSQVRNVCSGPLQSSVCLPPREEVSYYITYEQYRHK